LHVIGAFTPGIFTWGFHFFAYLPKGLLLGYIIAAIVAMLAIARGTADRAIGRMADFMSRNPLGTLAIAIALFAFTAFTFRINVPLLGDSFIAVKIFSKTVQGIQILPNSHQPLSLVYFYLFLKLLGTFEYPGLMNAFLAGELLLGVIFIAAVFFTVRNLFQNPKYQFLSFLLLLILPYMQIFYGYVEIYGVTLALLGVYVLVSVLHLRQKIHFAAVPVAYALLLLSHYLNALLFPSLVFLVLVEYKRSKFKQLLTGAGVLAVCALLGLIALDFNIEKLIPPNRGTPILSVFSSDNAFQAYTLFSPYHFSDLLNLAILLCPAAVFLILFSLKEMKSRFLSSPGIQFFVIAAAPIVLFIMGARFDIPMAQDWDVSASYPFLLVLCGLLFAEGEGDSRSNAVAVLVVVTLLNSLSWWYLNSTVEPNIARLRMFIDKRISSHDGIYQSTYHLSEYFVRAHDTQNLEEILAQFVSMYPTDKRGYTNYTLYLQQFGKQMDGKIIGIFDRWLALDPSNPDAHEQFANFYLDIGNRSYRDGSFNEAIGYYKNAARLSPGIPDPYNGLGISYRKLGQNDSARYYYEKTLLLDSTSVYACTNLGNLADDMGNTREAIAWYKRAISLQPNSPQAYFNLGIAYDHAGDAANAMESLRKAAQLGDADAQTFLRQRGAGW